jgi:hypothetical protein
MPMKSLPPFIDLFPVTPAVDRTDDRAAMTIRAMAAGSRVPPYLGFRPSAWFVLSVPARAPARAGAVGALVIA